MICNVIDVTHQYFLVKDIFVVLKETAYTVSDSLDTVSRVESEKVRVVSLCTTEITEITRFKKKQHDLQGPYLS